MTIETRIGLMTAAYMGAVSMFPVQERPVVAFSDLTSPSQVEQVVAMPGGQQVSAIAPSELARQEHQRQDNEAERKLSDDIERVAEQGLEAAEKLAEDQTEKKPFARDALEGLSWNQPDLESRQAQESASLDRKQAQSRDVQAETLVERRDQLADRYEYAAPDVQTEQLTKFDEAAKMVNEALLAQQLAERQALEARQAVELEVALAIAQRPPIDLDRTL